MIHIVWISYCKTATCFTVRFIHLVMETVWGFLFSFQFWFSLCKFASFFLIILVWMHLLLLFDASFFLFLLFVHVCVLLILLCWPLSVHAPCQHPLSKVNKCMCTLVGCHHTQTLKGAKLPPHLNQRLKKIQKRKVKEEKISKLRQTQSPKGKPWHVYWHVFCNVCDLPLHPPPSSPQPLPKQTASFLYSWGLFSFKVYQKRTLKIILAVGENTMYWGWIWVRCLVTLETCSYF